jgi:pyruvate,orthophosphate dikinase
MHYVEFNKIKYKRYNAMLDNINMFGKVLAENTDKNTLAGHCHPGKVSLLGGKGAHLAEMSSMGFPVPSGFTLPCGFYNYSDEELLEAIKLLEKETDKTYGFGDNPLILSVRSGATNSMPGVLDTILNVGLNDYTVEKLSSSDRSTRDIRSAYDSYRRFIQSYAYIVHYADTDQFEYLWEDYEELCEGREEMSLHALKNICEDYKRIYFNMIGKDFPQDPMVQLKECINAVFRSWNCKAAKCYRESMDIKDDSGTAVNVQVMVFGNSGMTSGTGIAYTSGGDDVDYRQGEFLFDSQGDDIVSGEKTPLQLSELKKELPKVYSKLISVFDDLDSHYGSSMYVEFTIENGEVYILQTRKGE